MSNENILKMKIDTKKLTIQEIESEVIKHKGFCVSCLEPLENCSIEVEKHPSGRQIKGLNNLQCIFFHCEKCDYMSRLEKIESRIFRLEELKEWKKNIVEKCSFCQKKLKIVEEREEGIHYNCQEEKQKGIDFYEHSEMMNSWRNSFGSDY